MVSVPKKNKARQKSGWLKIRATKPQIDEWHEAFKLALALDDELTFSSWVRGVLKAEWRVLTETAQKKPPR